MGERKLKTGLLGLDQRGQSLLKILSANDSFEVVALADKDATVAGRLAGQYGCTGIDDYRQFILQNTFDCLIVCARLYSCLEHVRMALKKKTHVLKWAPMARTFAEATELAALADAEGVRFDVANPTCYGQGLERFGRIFSEQASDRPFLVRSFWEIGMSEETGGDPATENAAAWMTDKGLAGGGVLLYEGYGLIDQVIRNLGLPQQVYCLSRSHTSNKAVPYIAEDVAVLSLRFREGLMGDLVLVRHWDARPGRSELTIHWKGQDLERIDCSGDRSEQVRQLLTDYAASHLNPDDHPFSGDAKANLSVMAVIEAAYISAQTGSPESPAKILERAL
jgi:predicted dehydrogenase